MKVTLLIPRPDFTNRIEKEFDFSFDELKALLYSYNGWPKKIPKLYEVGDVIDAQDPKTGITYKFTLTNDWLLAYKGIDFFTKENCAALEKVLLSLSALQERCNEAFTLYRSWYFSGGAERVATIDKINKEFEAFREHKAESYPRAIHHMVGCLIAERDEAIKQHTSQWSRSIVPAFFQTDKPKLVLALDPVINDYKKLLKCQEDKTLEAPGDKLLVEEKAEGPAAAAR